MPRLALLVWVVTLLIQLTIVITTPKGISWDPSYGLLAAQQQLIGMSPDIFTLVEADPANITQLVATPVSYWAPAYQAIPFAFRFAGLDWGMALNLTLATALVAGAVGWFLYFARVSSSCEIACWLSALLALTRFRWTMALTYDGGDQFIWAASPWVLIFAATALRFAQERENAGAAWIYSTLAGATGASLFALKYSGVFVAIGSALVFVSSCIRRRYWLMIVFASLGFVTVNLAIHWGGFPRGVTPANATQKMDILGSVAVFGMPAVGVTDLDRILRPFLSNGALSPVTSVLLIGLALSSVTFVGFACFVRSRPMTGPILGDRLLINLAVGAVIADVLIFFFLTLQGANISPGGRFGRVSGLLLLPILVLGWLAMLRDDRLIWRCFAVLSATIFLILPVTLATARQLPNLIDRFQNRAAAVDSDGVVNIALTPGADAQAFYAELRSISAEGVLYTIYPQMAFPLPRRPLILVEAEEQETIKTLSTRTYYGRPAHGVALLLPRAFQYNGKLDAIKSSFVDIPTFRGHEMRSDPKWVLWVGSD